MLRSFQPQAASVSHPYPWQGSKIVCPSGTLVLPSFHSLQPHLVLQYKMRTKTPATALNSKSPLWVIISLLGYLPTFWLSLPWEYLPWPAAPSPHQPQLAGAPLSAQCRAALPVCLRDPGLSPLASPLPFRCPLAWLQVFPFTLMGNSLPRLQVLHCCLPSCN